MIPALLGKAEGIVASNLLVFASLICMKWGQLLTGPEFVTCFTTWIGLFMGGTALASFRDWKKNGNCPTKPPKED